MPAWTPPIRGDGGAVLAGSIAAVESIRLNGVEQWLVLRGHDQANPVLLFLHGGPGTPETAPLIAYDRALEADFIVVSWDQRGAGKSYPGGLVDPAAITPAQLLEDTHALTAYLKARFAQQQIYLVAHSWGTILAIRAARESPADYAALVSIAQTSDALREEVSMHVWALEQARRAGDRRAIRELRGLNPGCRSIAERAVRVRWIERFGGGVMHRSGGLAELTRTIIRSPEYTLREKLTYRRATAFTLAHLFPDGMVPAIDLAAEVPAVDVPVWFVHGRFDQLVPLAVAHDYCRTLRAPAKTFVVFDESAHSPPFEEPERFHQLMLDVRDRAPGRAPQTR